MTTVNELIRKQAMAVKAGSNQIKAAKLLEDAAKLLRADATAPVKLDFSAIVKSKKASLEKFGAAIKTGRIKEAHQLLTQAGYIRGNHDDNAGTAIYGVPKKHGYRLRIDGDSFTVMHGTEVKQAKTSLRDLQKYLEINKTK